jgi:hypothetical protein
MPYKTPQVQNVKTVIMKEEHTFLSGFCGRYTMVFLTQKLITFFTHEAWFPLSGCINIHNDRYWISINPRQTFEVPLHDQKFATQMVGPKFFSKHNCLRADSRHFGHLL